MGTMTIIQIAAALEAAGFTGDEAKEYVKRGVRNADMLHTNLLLHRSVIKDHERMAKALESVLSQLGVRTT